MNRAVAPCLILVVVLCPAPAFGRGVGKLVTKATQAKLGLDFELAAVREPNAVIVTMKIPTAGSPGKPVQVRLSVPAEDQRHFAVRAPLEMKELDGAIQIGLQIAPEVAEKAYLDIVTSEGRTETYYAVKIAGYITDRK